MNDIIKMLNIEDDDIKIIDTKAEHNVKTITIEKSLTEHYCPYCKFKMHSRGIKVRTVNHPMLQDGCKFIIKIRQRRWRCTNQNCGYEVNDRFNFVSVGKQTTNAADFAVLNAFRNFEKTAEEIGRQFNMSGNKAMEIFNKYVHMKRLPLPEAISIDEVYFDFSNDCKYALVILDFYSNEPIDVVISRRSKYTMPYFSAIPKEERDKVKYLISDMYNPYLSYVETFFHNAIPIVDSFHVMQWITHKIDLFLRSLLKEYKERDIKNQNQGSFVPRLYTDNRKISDEVYLLEKARWVILKNQDNIDYSIKQDRNRHFGYAISTEEIERKFLALNKDLPKIRELKEDYVAFNSRNSGNPEQAAIELDELIDIYKQSGIQMFMEFSNTLLNYRKPIINSFETHVRLIDKKEKVSRLSNGPIESLNRKSKDMKRNARGFTNFEHFRNRFLFATREDAPISL